MSEFTSESDIFETTPGPPDEMGNMAFAIPFITCVILEGLAASFGNALVVFAVIKNKKLQTSSNLLMASLSCADFLVGPFQVTGSI